MINFTNRTGLVVGLAGLFAACSSSGENGTVLLDSVGTGAQVAGSTGGMIATPTGGGVATATGGVATVTGGVATATGGTPSETGGGEFETGGMAEATGGTPETGGEEGPADNGDFPAESLCLKDITDFGATGPFEYEAVREGSIKMWVPKVPEGCKVPVLHLANGTGGSCASYQNVLNSFASHGFLTTCYESGQTGAGTQGISAIEAAFQKYPDLAAKRIGSTGHSQGGQAAFVVLAFAEDKWGMDDYVYAGLSMEPASGFGSQPAGGSWQSIYATINSPMLAFSGTADGLVSQNWVERGFNALDDGIEAYHWRGRGTTHVPTPQKETIELGVPWWRWKLLNDPAACAAFKALKGAGEFAWAEIQVQNEAPCP